MRYLETAFTVVFYRRDATGRYVEVSRFPANSDMVAAYRLIPDAILTAARRRHGGQPIDGLYIVSSAGETVFRHPVVVRPHSDVD